MKKINSSKNTVVSKLNNEVSLIKEHNKIIFTELNIDKSSFYLRIEKEGRYKLLNDVEMIVDKNNCYFLPTTTKLCYNIKSLPIIVRTREAGDKINNKLIVIQEVIDMTDKKLQVIAEALDERKIIVSMNNSTAADRTYYEGMIQMAYYFGYEVTVDDFGHHRLIKL